MNNPKRDLLTCRVGVHSNEAHSRVCRNQSLCAHGHVALCWLVTEHKGISISPDSGDLQEGQHLQVSLLEVQPQPLPFGKYFFFFFREVTSVCLHLSYYNSDLALVCCETPSCFCLPRALVKTQR